MLTPCVVRRWRIRRMSEGEQMTRKQQDILDSLRAAGFDLSNATSTRGVRVRCSQCEAAVINGIAAHEHGCPNGRSVECGECGARFYGPDRHEHAAACCAPCEESEHSFVESETDPHYCELCGASETDHRL